MDEKNDDDIKEAAAGTVARGTIRMVKGWALEQYGALTHDPWLQIAGRREALLGKLEASLAESRLIAFDGKIPGRDK